MQLPKKISPDNIREAVVEIRYLSNLPFEVFLGTLFNALDKSYTYTNRPVQKPKFEQPSQANIGRAITIQLSSAGLFYNDKISVQVSPNALVFTCLKQYIGWSDYRPQIEKVLKQFMSSGHITKCTRVGIRYISEYPDRDISECIKFNFTFGFPEVQSETVAFRSEFYYKDSKIILNLSNKVPLVRNMQAGQKNEITKTSIVDIDVITDNLEIKELDDLLANIDDNHTKEKEIYFGMINDEFLKTLNPQY